MKENCVCVFVNLNLKLGFCFVMENVFQENAISSNGCVYVQHLSPHASMSCSSEIFWPFRLSICRAPILTSMVFYLSSGHSRHLFWLPLAVATVFHIHGSSFLFWGREHLYFILHRLCNGNYEWTCGYLKWAVNDRPIFGIWEMKEERYWNGNSWHCSTKRGGGEARKDESIKKLWPLLRISPSHIPTPTLSQKTILRIIHIGQLLAYFLPSDLLWLSISRLGMLKGQYLQWFKVKGFLNPPTLMRSL